LVIPSARLCENGINSFENNPSTAVKKYPELAGAVAVVVAMEKKAEANGINEQQRAIVMARVRQNVVNNIERGDIPGLRIREEKQIKTEQQHDLER
jgi:hypothetical protein